MCSVTAPCCNEKVETTTVLAGVNQYTGEGYCPDCGQKWTVFWEVTDSGMKLKSIERGDGKRLLMEDN